MPAIDKKLFTMLLGTGINALLVDTDLYLHIDLKGKGKPSSTGKTMLIATTNGNKEVGDVKVGINVYRPNPKV